jgi:hypothetical protein
MLTPEYVTAIEDWLKWYNEHYKTAEAGGVEQQTKFAMKALRGVFIILAGLTTEVERVDIGKEAAERARANRSPLVLPFGSFASR